MILPSIQTTKLATETDAQVMKFLQKAAEKEFFHSEHFPQLSEAQIKALFQWCL